ncbi:helix-turn-helix transcriptional regulator [Nakamurella sp. A5-74]|uniref:Helix-turn-helix transcriptional regulator n=1 Tax=Nakamurella sp. A5-74 TaxID=3158264 RepID=A0AAU8DQG5_9ACTN
MDRPEPSPTRSADREEGGRVLEFRRPGPAAESPAIDPLWRELAGARLRARRTELGRTLGEVAQRAGISPQYLSEVERGLKDPSSEMLASICGALQLDLAELLRHSILQLGLTSIRSAGDRHGPVLLAV